jgi:hypothetical protein
MAVAIIGFGAVPNLKFAKISQDRGEAVPAAALPLFRLASNRRGFSQRTCCGGDSRVVFSRFEKVAPQSFPAKPPD